MPDIVLIARGSLDPRHAEDVDALTDAVRDRVRAGRAVGACYLDHLPPGPVELAVDLTRRAVAVPLILAPGRQAQADVPSAVAALSAGGSDVRLAPTLGPDERLLDACAELLAAAGVQPDPETAVVLFAPGASGGMGVTGVAGTIERATQPEWGAWDVAAVQGEHSLENVVGRLNRGFERVVAVSFLIGAGALRDQMAARCEGLGVQMVPGTLARTSALADLVVARATG